MPKMPIVRIELYTFDDDDTFVCKVTRFGKPSKIYNVSRYSFRRLWSLSHKIAGVPWSYPHLNTYVWVF